MAKSLTGGSESLEPTPVQAVQNRSRTGSSGSPKGGRTRNRFQEIRHPLTSGGSTAFRRTRSETGNAVERNRLNRACGTVR